MNNCYYSVVSSNFKPNSAVLSPITFQPNLSPNLIERSVRDSNSNSPHLVNSNVQTVQRQDSSKNLIHNNSTKREIDTKRSQQYLDQHHRAFSDYEIKMNQMRASVSIGNSQNLPVGGGFNITQNKIIQKGKNKSELHRSNSRIGGAVSSQSKLFRLKTSDSIIELDRNDQKRQITLESLSKEMGKLFQRVLRNQQKLFSFQKKSLQLVNYQNNHTFPQIEEINKILNLIQKADENKNRDEYRKTMKMIEDLRTNILDCHAEIKKIKSDIDLEPKQHTNLKSESSKSIINDLINNIQKYKEENKQKFQQITAKIQKSISFNTLNQNSKRFGIHSSLRRFQGQMITFQYEQRLYPNSKSSKTKTEKKNNNKDGILINSKIYYLDTEGFLLDQDRFYLLNSMNEMIKLTNKEIQLLKNNNLI